ncbi:SIMPL domain-containing protein [Candidatus Parcubacteria bacterium]|nr:SIMPL domain-containing protein [Candidatus Parcubacteria bacterium]
MHEYFEHEEVKRFFKVATVAIGLLALFLFVETLSAWKSWRVSNPAYNTISVSGKGEAFATPDIATFTFSVSADAKAVADAQEAVTKKTDAITAALKDLGVDDKDIQTVDYSVYPKYIYTSVACTSSYCPPSRQVPDGYTVTNSLSVKVRQTANAGKALSEAGSKGATNISGLSFTVDDQTAIESEARAKAIADAKSKAETLAKNLGVRLVRVISFSDGYGGGPIPYYAKDVALGMGGTANQAVAPSLEPGQNKVTDNVTITYEIH